MGRADEMCGEDGYSLSDLIDDVQAVYAFQLVCRSGKIKMSKKFHMDCSWSCDEFNDDDLDQRNIFGEDDDIIKHQLLTPFREKVKTYMATVQRSTQAAPSPVKAATAKAAPIKLILPTTPRIPIYDINRHIALVVGPPGCGKTTLCTQIGGVFVLSFDPLRETLPIVQEHVPDWATFLNWLDALTEAAKAKKLPYKRVVLDGLDICFRLCQDYICQEMGIEHPTDAGYGKGWDRLNTEFASAMDRFLGIPACGKWFVCHSADKEIVKRDGRKVQSLVPAIKGGAERVVAGKCDIILMIQYEGEERVATVRGDESVTAKACIDGRFLTPKGNQVREIHLGNEGPAKAYANLVSAYDNKQWYSTYDQLLAWQAKQAAAKIATLTK